MRYCGPSTIFHQHPQFCLILISTFCLRSSTSSPLTYNQEQNTACRIGVNGSSVNIRCSVSITDITINYNILFVDSLFRLFDFTLLVEELYCVIRVLLFVSTTLCNLFAGWTDSSDCGCAFQGDESVTRTIHC